MHLDTTMEEHHHHQHHLLIEGNPYTKFVIDQVKGSKDIERTTQWAEKSGLTLNFEDVT